MRQGLEGKKDKKRFKKTNLNFQGKKRSKRGVISMVLSLLSLAGFVTASVMSGIAKGAAGIVVGYIGIGCLLVAAIGFYLGARSLRERDIRYLHPVFGMAVSGLLLVALIALYLTGLL